MKSKNHTSTFVPLPKAACQLGVPESWLKSQANSGKLPAIRAGRRILIHLDGARSTLAAQAKSHTGGDE